MRTLATLSIIMLASACAPKPERPDFGEFEPYVQELEYYAESYHVTLDLSDLDIKYGTFEEPNKRATCVHHSDGRTITLSEVHWPNLPHEVRRWVFAHEFGHCILGLYHNPEIESDGRPFSIMHPYMYSDTNAIAQNWEEYMGRLYDPYR